MGISTSYTLPQRSGRSRGAVDQFEFGLATGVRFGTGSTQLQSQSFGVLTGAGSQINSPRQLQLALKLYF